MIIFTADMVIAVITENHTEKDLVALFPGAGIKIHRQIPEGHDPAIAAWLDLDFVNEPARVEKLSRLLPALVIINAVVPTLQEIKQPFTRINAWPGFGTQKVHELVIPDEATEQRIKALYETLDCRYVSTPDLPGMISARVVAGIINEAWYTWEEKVSSKEEIDTAMRLGTNYPAGPFEWGERIGLGQVAGLLWSLSKIEPRYTPARSLREETAPVR